MYTTMSFLFCQKTWLWIKWSKWCVWCKWCKWNKIKVKYFVGSKWNQWFVSLNRSMGLLPETSFPDLFLNLYLTDACLWIIFSLWISVSITVSNEFHPEPVWRWDFHRTFDLETYSKLMAVEKHFGLMNMRERAVMVGGSFHIESSPAKGTTVNVSVPLKAKDETRKD